MSNSIFVDEESRLEQPGNPYSIQNALPERSAVASSPLLIGQMDSQRRKSSLKARHNLMLWFGILLLSTAISLDVQTMPQFQSYALSSFGGSAWLASFSGIQNFINATARPPVARLAAQYGHFRVFVMLVITIVLGFILSASTTGIGVLAVGQSLCALGQVGIQFLQNIIVADNSALENRALATALPNTPFIVTVFAVAPISQALLPDSWRLGYILWALSVLVASIPLLIRLWTMEQPSGIEQNILPGSPKPEMPQEYSQSNFDVMGLTLFTTSLTLIFFSSTPVTTTFSSHIQPFTMVIGIFTLSVFLHHQLFIATTPILELRLLKSRTIAAGCGATFFYFFSFSIYQPYLYPYLVISENLSISSATNAGLIFMFASIISTLAASFLLKFTKSYRWLSTSGAGVRLLGSVVMLVFTSPYTGKWTTYGYQAFAGIGMGLGSYIVQVGVQAAAHPKDIGALLALYATIGSFGGFLGDSVSSAIFSPTLTSQLRASLPPDMQSPSIINAIKDSIIVATSYVRGTPARDAIDASWAQTMRVLHWWSLGVLAVVCMLVCLMEDLSLDESATSGHIRSNDGNESIRDVPQPVRQTEETRLLD